MAKGRKKIKNSPRNTNIEVKKEPSEVCIAIPTRKNVEDFLKQRIIGQDDFIRKVLVAIYKHLVLGMKSNILIIGGSGTGKTETLINLANILGLPYTLESATEYTQSGYVGLDLWDIMDHLQENALSKNTSMEQIQCGLVIMDEIDKKASAGESFGGDDIAGKAVQHRLLKFMDGIDMDIMSQTFPRPIVNTRNLIFVCMGAFEGLKDIRDQRLNRKQIGFKVKQCNKNDQNEYIEQDFIKYGFIKEFIGRFDYILETRNLSLQDLEQIIRNSKISAFREYEEMLKTKNVKLVYSDEVFKNIAKKAFAMNIGARAIKNVTNYAFEKIICDIMDSLERTEVVDCKLYDNIAYDNSLYAFE